ncbi:hypothetical protein NP233_g5009 [Leucocoprinus birnbaumii]|uniref:Uncharacterized protein n=1 Tax=Leucocoprinus birnbaumii TaxID=56174 RepID=A0AAD5VTM6_9AGAR|nr:hypothetical protein NP233_g5009 [Leucocoprinus birnbaumii]
MAIMNWGEQQMDFIRRAQIPAQQGRPFSEYVAGYMFETFLYGINVMLFLSAVWILTQKYKEVNRWPLLLAVFASFSIATACICTSIFMLFAILMYDAPTPVAIARAEHMYMLFNTTIADILLTTTTIVSCTAVTLSGVTQNMPSRDLVFCFWEAASADSSSCLKRSSCDYINRQARKALGPGLAKKYYSFLTVVIESGAVYSLYILLDQILVSTRTPSFFVDTGLTQIAFFAPTLIIVQLGLGRHIRDVQSTIQANSDTTVVFTTVYPDDISMSQQTRA